ncbi:MAG: FG-GAP repeat domain-containing protein, partial [Planctomycetia bacterium]
PLGSSTTTRSSRDVQMADINGDGKLDIVSSNYDKNLILNLGNGNGTFKTFTTINAGSGAKPYSIQVADLNRDGKLDIVTSLPSFGRFSILLGNGDGKFKTATFLASTLNNTNFVLTDINNDGKLDIVTEIGNGDTTTSQVGV